MVSLKSMSDTEVTMTTGAGDRDKLVGRGRSGRRGGALNNSLSLSLSLSDLLLLAAGKGTFVGVELGTNHNQRSHLRYTSHVTTVHVIYM